jgi:IclR family acetate operon transcriptional repressor
MAGKSYRVQSAERLLDVLEAVAASTHGLRAGEIAAALGLPFSTAHRLATLAARRGYLRMDTDTRRYHLGPTLLRLRGGRAGPASLEEAARPLVQRLAAELGETACFAMYDVAGEPAALVLCSARPRAVLCAFWPPGMRLPLHATAPGKVLLAFGPPERAAEVIQRGLVRCTERTLTDPQALAEELRQVRAQGYATEVDEYEQGLAGLAVPAGSGGDLAGAFGIAAPSARFGQPARLRALELLRAAATALAFRVDVGE